MKKIFLLCLIVFMSCKDDKIPKCKSIENIDLGNLTKEHSKFSALLVLSNPDKSIDYTFKNATIDILINGKDAGTLVVDLPKIISHNSDTKIPISYKLTVSDFDNDERKSGSYNIEFKGTAFLKNNESKDIEEISINEKYTIDVNIKKELRKVEHDTKREEKKSRREAKKLEKQNRH